MHYLALAFKRVHLRSLALARPFAQRLGLTPSRFEICHFILSTGDAPRQFHIRNALGVSAVTISRMVRRMAELGLVKRTKVGRKAFVGLTDEGKRRVERVIKEVLTRFLFSKDFERAWGTPSRHTKNIANMVERYLVAIIVHLKGRATHWYPRPPPAAHELALDV